MVVEGGKTGQVAPLVKLLVVGRGTAARLRLECASVSRVHCRFERGSDGQVKVRDLRSSNGTFVNGARSDFQALVSGDRIRVGTVTLVYFDDGGQLDEVFGATPDAIVGPEADEAETRVALVPA